MQKLSDIAIHLDAAQLAEGMRRLAAAAALGITVAEVGVNIAAYQQHAEREQYIYQARVLGVAQGDAEAFDATLIAYAQTCAGSNTDVWRGGWQQAIDQLKRGGGLPTIPC
jgi:hypothetical protein